MAFGSPCAATLAAGASLQQYTAGGSEDDRSDGVARSGAPRNGRVAGRADGRDRALTSPGKGCARVFDTDVSGLQGDPHVAVLAESSPCAARRIVRCGRRPVGIAVVGGPARQAEETAGGGAGGIGRLRQHAPGAGPGVDQALPAGRHRHRLAAQDSAVAVALPHSRSQRLQLRRPGAHRRQPGHRRGLRGHADLSACAAEPARGGRRQARVVREADGDACRRGAVDDRRLRAQQGAAEHRLPHAARAEHAAHHRAGRRAPVRRAAHGACRGRLQRLRRHRSGAAAVAAARAVRRWRDVRHGRVFA